MGRDQGARSLSPIRWLSFFAVRRVSISVLFLVGFLGCGGRIFGQDNNAPSPTDPGASADSNDPLGGGGHLLSGKCHFTSSFRPHGGDWIFQTDTDGVSTATRSNVDEFALLFTGKGNESDCPSLLTLTGEFTHKGSFTVPLP
jgi:hypothetical protein